MKRYAWLALVALLGCGAPPPGVSPPPERFQAVYAQGPDTFAGFRVLVFKDTKSGACFVWVAAGYGGGLTAAPPEVCQ